MKYYEYDQLVQLPLASITHIKPVEVGAIREDDIVYLPYKCQVKYAMDGQWYDAQITAKTLYVPITSIISTSFKIFYRYGYQITYTNYGNSEEVPLEYIRQVSKRMSSDNNSVIPIPAHLKILPTDTEEVLSYLIFLLLFNINIHG